MIVTNLKQKEANVNLIKMLIDVPGEIPAVS